MGQQCYVIKKGQPKFGNKLFIYFPVIILSFTMYKKNSDIRVIVNTLLDPLFH